MFWDGRSEVGRNKRTHYLLETAQLEQLVKAMVMSLTSSQSIRHFALPLIVMVVAKLLKTNWPRFKSTDCLAANSLCRVSEHPRSTWQAIKLNHRRTHLDIYSTYYTSTRTNTHIMKTGLCNEWPASEFSVMAITSNFKDALARHWSACNRAALHT